MTTPVPIIGQHPSHEEMLMATYRQLYFSLIPTVAAKLLDRETLSDPVLDGDNDDLYMEIAQKADKIAIAAMRQAGVAIER